MEITTKAAWATLALIHLTPALVVFAPSLAQKLYGIPSTGDLSVLLLHRGALFLAVFMAAIYAMFSPDARRLATLVLAVSMISFLILYARAGFPEGALRKIAMMDAVGLVPLAFVCWRAWT